MDTEAVIKMVEENKIPTLEDIATDTISARPENHPIILAMDHIRDLTYKIKTNTIDVCVGAIGIVTAPATIIKSYELMEQGSYGKACVLSCVAAWLAYFGGKLVARSIPNIKRYRQEKKKAAQEMMLGVYLRNINDQND